MTEDSTYLALYPDGTHQKISLGNMLNKGGAAGKIFEVSGQPKVVAKIFHDREKSESNRKKLEAMLHNKPKKIKTDGIAEKLIKPAQVLL